jgi:hypothetical protein
MYDVNAENRPLSIGFGPLSIIWEGFCSGIDGISNRFGPK